MSDSKQCLTCKHYEGALTCAAFPNGIPVRILTGEVDHRQPVPGDNGIRWQPLNAVAAELMADLDGDDDE